MLKKRRDFWMNLQMTYDLRNAEKALPARVRKSIADNRSVVARYVLLTTVKTKLEEYG